MHSSANYSQTAGRALDVLSLFYEHNGLTLSETARLMGLGTTITYRLLNTLVAKGFLAQEPHTKIYRLGEQTLLLGYKAIQSQGLKSLAQPFMRQLTDCTGLEAFLTVCVGGRSLCLDRTYNGKALQTAMTAGATYPLHKGATNRVLLAFLPEEEQQRYLAALEEPPEKTLRLTRILRKIREHGYDYSQEDLTVGLFSVACPVLDSEGKLAGSISIGGLTINITETLRKQYIRSVRKAASGLNRLMGYQTRTD